MVIDTQNTKKEYNNSRIDKQMREDVNRLFLTKRSLYESSGETSLWQSVLIQAALDIFSHSKCSKAIRAKSQAIEWFSKNNEDFLYVCSFANLDPDFVIRGMKKAVHRYKRKPISQHLGSIDRDPESKSLQKAN